MDGIFLAADRLDKGSADPAALKALNDQLTRLQETEPSRGSLSSEEKNTLSIGYWSDRHVETERKLNIDSLLKGTDKKDPEDRSRAIPSRFPRWSYLQLLCSAWRTTVSDESSARSLARFYWSRGLFRGMAPH